MFIALKTDDGRIKGKISFYCKALKVSRQAFNNYLKTKAAQWKYQSLADGPYEINKMGQIRNKRTKNILKPQIKNAGYLVYTLYIDRKIYYRQAHILVARQFIPNPDNKPIVNHKDENKMNPCVDNLEWVTEIENANYGTSKKRGAKGKEKPVDEYSVDGIYIRTWRSTVSICLFFANDTDATALKNYITTILKYNKENEIKKTFANTRLVKSDIEDTNRIICKSKRTYHRMYIGNSSQFLTIFKICTQYYR